MLALVVVVERQAVADDADTVGQILRPGDHHARGGALDIDDVAGNLDLQTVAARPGQVAGHVGLAPAAPHVEIVAADVVLVQRPGPVVVPEVSPAQGRGPGE